MPAVEISDALRELFELRFPAVVGTTRSDGSVQLNPAWFEYCDELFWLNTRRHSRWLAHIERDRAATLLLIDPERPFRIAQIQTRLAGTHHDESSTHLHRLARRYTGGPFRGPPAQRVVIRLEPTRITNSIDNPPHGR